METEYIFTSHSMLSPHVNTFNSQRHTSSMIVGRQWVMEKYQKENKVKG